MINRVVLVGEIDGEVKFAVTTRNETMAYFSLRTWHRWFDPVRKRHATKSERHLVVSIRNDLVDVIRRRASLAGLVYIEGALSAITDLTPGVDPSRQTAAVVIHRDGQMRFMGSATADAETADLSEAEPG
jgi:single-stranded DNA-binding protein